MIRYIGLFFLLFVSTSSAEQYTSLRGLPVDIDIDRMEVRTDHTIRAIDRCDGFEICLMFYDYIIAVPNSLLTAGGHISEQHDGMRVDSLPFIESVTIFGRTVEGRVITIYEPESFTLLSKLLYSPFYGVISFSVSDSTYWMSGTCGIYASEECNQEEDEE